MKPQRILLVRHGQFEATRNLKNCEILQLQLQRDGHYLPVEPFLR
jgi:hypothetical protein